MIEKQKKELEKAKEYFFSWQLNEAYSILRRFFDRLPFAPELDHALYLSYFIRCMLELGKERELDFYLKQIEQLSAKWKTPELSYQLAEVCCLSQNQDLPRAKQLLSQVISNPEAKHIHPKAKIFLAYCYDLEEEDVAACKRIIDSVTEEISDRPTQLMLELWKLKILRDQGKFQESETLLKSFLNQIDPQRDWYAFFSAQVILGGLYLKQERTEEASLLLMELNKKVKNSPFRTIRAQINSLETKIGAQKPLPEVTCEQGIRAWTLSFKQKIIEIRHQSNLARLLELFLKKDWVDKATLTKRIFKKDYVAEDDDNKIHALVHAFRKILQELNLDLDPICFEQGGYRLIPKLKIPPEET